MNFVFHQNVGIIILSPETYEGANVGLVAKLLSLAPLIKSYVPAFIIKNFSHTKLPLLETWEFLQCGRDLITGLSGTRTTITILVLDQQTKSVVYFFL